MQGRAPHADKGQSKSMSTRHVPVKRPLALHYLLKTTAVWWPSGSPGLCSGFFMLGGPVAKGCAATESRRTKHIAAMPTAKMPGMIRLLHCQAEFATTVHAVGLN
eukprot:11529978-Prorocentrum_lima.AAC.1